MFAHIHRKHSQLNAYYCVLNNSQVLIKSFQQPYEVDTVPILWIIDLKNKTASYFTSKMDLFRNCRELQFRDGIAKTIGKSRKQRRGTLLYREKRSWGGGVA